MDTIIGFLESIYYYFYFIKIYHKSVDYLLFLVGDSSYTIPSNKFMLNRTAVADSSSTLDALNKLLYKYSS